MLVPLPLSAVVVLAAVVLWTLLQAPAELEPLRVRVRAAALVLPLAVGVASRPSMVAAETVVVVAPQLVLVLPLVPLLRLAALAAASGPLPVRKLPLLLW